MRTKQSQSNLRVDAGACQWQHAKVMAGIQNKVGVELLGFAIWNLNVNCLVKTTSVVAERVNVPN